MKPSISALADERDAHLRSFPLNREQGESQSQDARDTQDAPLPPAVIESLSVTPENADRLSGARPFIEWVTGRSEAALRMILESDLYIIKAITNGDEIVDIDRPFGLKETILPVRDGKSVVGALWCGKYRPGKLAKDTVSALSTALRIPGEALSEALDGVPVLTSDERERHVCLMRQVRDALELALTSQARYRESVRQLLDSERIRSLGTLSGGVAHHFNNLLSVILGYASFLLNRTEVTSESGKALREISEAAQKGRRLTEEILAFAGSEVEQETACSVHEILQSALSLLETQTAGRVKVITRLDAGKDAVRAPRSVLHQTVFNLLTNAMDSMPKGGELAVATNNTTVAIAGEDVPHIRIEVLDSGATELAVQDAQARKRKVASLHGMVNQLEGTAVLSSEGGMSNRAEVVLPLDRTVSAVIPQKKVRKRLAPSRIWIVDDDPIFCEMCERVLKDDGHDVRSISSGSALHQEWEQTKEPPSLLIIDFSMPEYNGLELCTWLREKGSRAPVILVSGFSHTQPDIHKALKMRKTYFLQKPFPVPELADIVTVALGETLLGN